ncbi:MAG: hypothetical protein U0W65_17535 [Bacteroidia bacterium]
MKEIAITIKIGSETPRTIIVKAVSKEEAEKFFIALNENTSNKKISAEEINII